MSGIDPQMLVGAGLVLGGMMGGLFSAAKVPWIREQIRGNNNNGGSGIEKSQKTSGALHISEEALQKIDHLNDTLNMNYMTEKRHADICGRQQLEMKLYISEQLEKHTGKILTALKKNGFPK